MSWPHLLLPVLYLAGFGIIFSIISGPLLKILFLVLGSVLFYWLEINIGRESHLLQNLFLLSAFALYVGVFAFQFYFNLNTGWVVLMVAGLTMVLILQGFAGFSLPTKKVFALSIVLICSELAWGLSMWPTHFLVNGVVLFAAFYLLWFLSFSAFFGKLTRRKILWHLGLISFVLIITLASANWQPILP